MRVAAVATRLAWPAASTPSGVAGGGAPGEAVGVESPVGERAPPLTLPQGRGPAALRRPPEVYRILACVCLWVCGSVWVCVCVCVCVCG